MNALIISHATPIKLNQKQRKFQQKPWITRGIQNSIHKNKRLCKKYIKFNKHSNKNALHNEYKAYRNNLSTLVKPSKKLYYGNYFKNNINSLNAKYIETSQLICR